LWAEFLLKDHQRPYTKLAVGTIHLESLKHNAAYRKQQLHLVFPILLSASDTSVLMGDFNFCSSWDENTNITQSEYTDLWDALHGSDPGYTEDTDLNKMLYAQRQETKKVRFDRVILRDETKQWEPSTIRILGTEPFLPPAGEPEVWISDHFGLQASVARKMQ